MAKKSYNYAQLEAVVEWDVWEGGLGGAAYVNLCAGALGEFAVAGDEVGVQMSL